MYRLSIPAYGYSQATYTTAEQASLALAYIVGDRPMPAFSIIPTWKD